MIHCIYGEAIDYSNLKIYEKFASTPNGSEGTQVAITDSRVAIKDITGLTITDTTDISTAPNATTNLAEGAFGNDYKTQQYF